MSETEVISRAIHNFYIKLKKEEQISDGGAIVSFSEYYKVQEQLHAKEELIAELRAKLVRRWWEFWK